MVQLENLNWKPKWVSLLGCLQGCLKFLGIEITDSWLYGASGHAFIINIHEVVCPSGPTAWVTREVLALCENAGCKLEVIVAHKSDGNFIEKQQLAWQKIRNGIDHGSPCFGWDLDIPEYYVIYGYDEAGYYFRGPLIEAGKGPKSPDTLGDSEIGVVEVIIVKPGSIASPESTVKQALGFALEFAKNPAKWILPDYRSGLAGYDRWIQALQDGKANAFGIAYNAAVWAECRQHAAEFLEEAGNMLEKEVQSLLVKASEHYSHVSQNLMHIKNVFPMSGAPFKENDIDAKDQLRIQSTIEYLQAARAAEKSGLEELDKIVSLL